MIYTDYNNGGMTEVELTTLDTTTNFSFTHLSVNKTLDYCSQHFYLP